MPHPSAPGLGRELALQGAGVLDEPPIGAVAFGSWARGDAAAESDIDVVMIVDRATPIDRDLYRRWDEAAAAWEGRRVDAHFAYLPEPGEPITAQWAELACDGIVLFDDELRVARLLGSLRRRLLQGRELERREAHGQPYWVATR